MGGEMNKGQKCKAAMLVGAVVMVVSGLSCSLTIAREWAPWLTTLCVVGFVVGLVTYVVGDVVAWWRSG